MAQLFSYILFFLILPETFSSNIFQRPEINRENYVTLAAHMNADHLNRALRQTVNDRLGVPAMQTIIDGLSFEKRPINASIVGDIASRLDIIFEKYRQMLDESRVYVRDSYKKVPISMNVFRSFTECARMRSDQLRQDDQFGTRVNLSFACNVVARSASPFIFYPDKNLTSIYQGNVRDPVVRWQYMFGFGAHIEYPAHLIPSQRLRHWSQYIAAALPYPKRLIILLDYGTIQTEMQLIGLKKVAKLLLEGVARGDSVAVLAAGGGGTIRSACGQSSPLVEPHPANLDAIAEFIDDLRLSDRRENFSHADAIQKAYRMLIEEGDPSSSSNVIIYVSRGVMSELSDAARVLQAIANVALDSGYRIRINTLALADTEKAPMLWPTEFLVNIAEQNFDKYRQSFPAELNLRLDQAQLKPIKGTMLVVREGDSYGSLTLSQLTDLLEAEDHWSSPPSNGTTAATPPSSPAVHWSFPFSEQGTLLLSCSMPVADVQQQGRLLAVVGLDLNVDLITDRIRHSEWTQTAALHAAFRLFVTDLQGRVLVDSKQRGDSPFPRSLADLESWSPSDRWVADFASDDVTEGTFHLRIAQIDNSSFKMTYKWQKLRHVPLVVVLGVRENELNGDISMLERSPRQKFSLDRLVYHRLDVQSDRTIPYCDHLRSLSTTMRGGVYLSPACFTAPRQRGQSAQRVANYWVYLGDSAGLIRNTGVRAGVREHVGALSGIVGHWIDHPKSASDSHFILRRYVASSRGVLLTYPATQLNENFQPTEQPWYQRALAFPGRVVLTGPYMDEAVGPVLTISHTVFEGTAGSLHSVKDQVFAVIAMDVTTDFITRMLRTTLTACRESRRCVLFDDAGSVLSGAPLRVRSSAATSDPVERFHLSHLEPSLAIHLLLNLEFVQKMQCVHWESSTVERLFRFNTSYSDVVAMKCEIAGGNSLKAEVIPVPHTNVFLALLNDSCANPHSPQTFCPCSVTDRRCLLCSRFDALECECPCECPIRDQCSSTMQTALLNQAVLQSCNENVRSMAFVARPSNDAQLAPCTTIRCSDRLKEDDCLGVIGCQWCVIADGGIGILDVPYCSAIDQCFEGVRGRSIHGFFDSSSPTSNWSMATPVGPVAIAIMTVFVLLVVAVYCYRSHMSRMIEQRSTDSFGVPLCPHMHDDGDDVQFDHDGSASEEKISDDIRLTSFEQRAAIHPGRLMPQLRPSPRTESSDHGYSTMTDRNNGDDSECGTTIGTVDKKHTMEKNTTSTTYIGESPTCGGVAMLITTEVDVHREPESASSLLMT